MRDINFFRSFIEKKDFKISKNLILFTVCSFLILFIIGYAVYNTILIRQESKIVESLRATAEDPKILKKVEEIKSKEAEINEFRASVEKIRLLDSTIDNRDIIDEELLDAISSKLGDKIFLTSLSIQNDEIYIVGISKDKWEIAEFIKGIETLDIHEEIFASNISQQNDHYSFSLNIQLRSDGNGGHQ